MEYLHLLGKEQDTKQYAQWQPVLYYEPVQCGSVITKAIRAEKVPEGEQEQSPELPQPWTWTSGPPAWERQQCSRTDTEA